jgi:mRNA interferase RelE/StbE
LADWNYVFLKPAERYLQRLRLSDRERIVNALKSLLVEPGLCDIKPLKGRSDWRLRVGDYRVLFLMDNENKVFIVTRIGSRGNIYKK